MRDSVSLYNKFAGLVSKVSEEVVNIIIIIV